MTYQPGQSGNKLGGQNPSRRKGTREVLLRINEAGYRDPLLTLARIQHESTDVGEQVQAASALAPFLHPKLQAIPTARFIENPFEVPDFQTVTDAESFLATIATRTARGELDFQSALELTALTKAWLDSKNAHTTLDLKAESQGHQDGELTITITGGLPPLPGTNISMPELNSPLRQHGYEALQNDSLPDDPHSPPAHTIDAIAGDLEPELTAGLPAVEPELTDNLLSVEPDPPPINSFTHDLHNGPPVNEYLCSRPDLVPYDVTND
jgi:hypothetical protein